MEILFIKTLPPEQLHNLFLNGPGLVFILFLVLAQFLCRYQPVPVILIKAALVCTDAFFLFSTSFISNGSQKFIFKS